MINTKEVFCCSQENHEGRCPLTRGITPGPSRAIGPAPSSGIYSSYLTNNFPMKQVKKAPLCKGSWPAGPEGLSSPFHETRRTPLAKANCNIASWMRHWRPHTGPVAACRQPDAKHPGKTEKGAGGNLFPATPFFVFIGPVVLFLFVSSNEHAKTTAFDSICFIALRVQGQWPCRGVQGLRKPLPWSASASGFLS